MKKKSQKNKMWDSVWPILSIGSGVLCMVFFGLSKYLPYDEEDLLVLRKQAQFRANGMVFTDVGFTKSERNCVQGIIFAFAFVFFTTSWILDIALKSFNKN